MPFPGILFFLCKLWPRVYNISKAFAAYLLRTQIDWAVVISMKQIPNVITCMRILGSVALLFLTPLSPLFFWVYLLCGATDIIDGYLARKMGVVSKAGAVLDSVADLVFVAVILYVFISAVTFPAWVIFWAAGVAVVRVCALVIGYIKYRAFAGLHTYANKATGVLLFIFPLLYHLLGMTAAACPVLIVASIAAIEETAIHITSSSLNRDTPGLFAK